MKSILSAVLTPTILCARRCSHVALAEAHLDDADREVRNLATALFVHFQRLFTFLEQEGVEPTNNVAERTLRTAVQWRKISSATAATTANWPQPVYSPSPRLASGRAATSWATSPTPYAAIAVRPRHLLCSRSGPDHLNSYDGFSVFLQTTCDRTQENRC